MSYTLKLVGFGKSQKLHFTNGACIFLQLLLKFLIVKMKICQLRSKFFCMPKKSKHYIQLYFYNVEYTLYSNSFYVGIFYEDLLISRSKQGRLYIESSINHQEIDSLLCACLAPSQASFCQHLQTNSNCGADAIRCMGMPRKELQRLWA